MNDNTEKILKEITLELVEAHSTSVCSMCMFDEDTCPALRVGGCKEGYWRVKQSWAQATTYNVKVGDTVRVAFSNGTYSITFKVLLVHKQDVVVVPRVNADSALSILQITTNLEVLQ